MYIETGKGAQDVKIIIFNSTISFHRQDAIDIRHYGKAIKTIVEKCTLDNNYKGVRSFTLSVKLYQQMILQR